MSWLSSSESMQTLGVKTHSAMWKIAKKFKLKTKKDGKNIFYRENEILSVKAERENGGNNQNSKNAKDEKRTELIAKNEAKKAEMAQAVNLPVAASDTGAGEAKLKERMNAVIKELKEIGLYEICDKSLIYSYCLTEIKLDEVAAQMRENFTTYDDKGNEKPHPLTKIYADFLAAKLNLAKALGLGAGNRKGLKISEIIEIDEMEKLLNG